MIAVVLMAYGTPTGRADIARFYTDIRHGRAPLPEQLAALTARYDAIAGDDGDALSPLMARTEAQRGALQRALEVAAPGEFTVLLGFKHSSPSIEQACAAAAAGGGRGVIGLVLAPHYSAFSVGQYRQRLEQAAGRYALSCASITSWATEPAFIQFVAADLVQRLSRLPNDSHVLFTAHSLPQRILDSNDPYPDELAATATAVAAAAQLDDTRWSVAWQSAGRTDEPWLGPDVLQAIDALADGGRFSAVVVSAVGFVADHLEVLYDLDIEAADRARQRGLQFDRSACVNDDAAVIGALARRVIETAR